MSRSSPYRIVRATGILGLATSVSRILGFVRDLLIAGLFGTGAAAQAFVVAFRLPNMLRDLVAEGAVTSAFVPVLSGYRAEGREREFWELSQALFCRVLLLVGLLGLCGTVGAPWIVRVIAPGFMDDPEKFDLTVRLTRLLFPFITLVGLWAFFMGLLNSLRHFATPALGPAVLNGAMIAALVWVVPKVEPNVLGLVYGVMVGAILQLAIQLPVAIRLGFRFRFRWKHPGASEIIRLLGPRTLGSAVYQVNVLVHTALASLSFIVGNGAVAALYFANRLVQLPLAVFGSSTAQASLPALSEMAAKGDKQGFGDTVVSVMRLSTFALVPSAIGLMVMAFPIVEGLFERGAFDHQATVMTAQALIFYAAGLMAFGISKIVSGAFYALKDTWTPVKLASEAVALNVFLSVVLMGPMQVMGLALAASVSNTLNAFRLLRELERKLDQRLLAPFLKGVAPMLAAALVMGLISWIGVAVVGSRLSSWLSLLVVILFSFLSYLGLSRLLNVPEAVRVQQWLLKRSILQRFASK